MQPKRRGKTLRTCIAELSVTIKVQVRNGRGVENTHGTVQSDHTKYKWRGTEGQNRGSNHNKIAHVIEKELASVEEEEKATFLQVIVEILVDTPLPLEDVKEDKSELIFLRKEIKELKLFHKEKTYRIGE